MVLPFLRFMQKIHFISRAGHLCLFPPPHLICGRCLNVSHTLSAQPPSYYVYVFAHLLVVGLEGFISFFGRISQTTPRL